MWLLKLASQASMWSQPLITKLATPRLSQHSCGELPVSPIALLQSFHQPPNIIYARTLLQGACQLSSLPVFPDCDFEPPITELALPGNHATAADIMNNHFAAVGEKPADGNYEHGVQVT